MLARDPAPDTGKAPRQTCCPKEHQAGLGAKELCRKHGVSDATFYKWRAKFGGMEVSDAKKLKALEAENAKLKKLLAEQMMDVSTLKEMLGKNF